MRAIDCSELDSARPIGAGIREAAVVELEGHHYESSSMCEDVIEPFTTERAAAMGPGWERSPGIVEARRPLCWLTSRRDCRVGPGGLSGRIKLFVTLTINVQPTTREAEI